MSVRTETDQRQYLHLPGPWRLEHGGVLPEITVAYETYGHLNAAGDNAILVCHALTGDSHVAAHHPGDTPGWWETLVGAGRPLDTREYFIICSNVLGGCQGTTGPASPHPVSGRRYGLDFPTITVGDMVRVQQALLTRLGIRRLRLVIGGSLGGMQALEWVASAAVRVDRALVIGAPWASSAQAITWNEIGRQAILTDPRWQNGDYPDGEGPDRGLAIARMINMVSYRSWDDFAGKFGRAQVGPDEDPVAERTGGDYATRLPKEHPFRMRFQVESYLHYQGQKLVDRFDACTYLYLTRAMDLFDSSVHGDESWRRVARSGVRVGVVGISSDLLYPAHEVRDLAATLDRLGLAVTYHQIESPLGHDAFLLDDEQTGAIVAKTLED